MAYCSNNVCWRSRHFGTSAEVSARQLGTGANLSGHFGTNLTVPKCLGSEVSWVRSVLTPLRLQQLMSSSLLVSSSPQT